MIVTVSQVCMDEATVAALVAKMEAVDRAGLEGRVMGYSWWSRVLVYPSTPTRVATRAALTRRLDLEDWWSTTFPLSPLPTLRTARVVARAMAEAVAEVARRAGTTPSYGGFVARVGIEMAVRPSEGERRGVEEGRELLIIVNSFKPDTVTSFTVDKMDTVNIESDDEEVQLQETPEERYGEDIFWDEEDHIRRDEEMREEEEREIEEQLREEDNFSSWEYEEFEAEEEREAEKHLREEELRQQRREEEERETEEQWREQVMEEELYDRLYQEEGDGVEVEWRREEEMREQEEREIREEFREARVSRWGARLAPRPWVGAPGSSSLLCPVCPPTATVPLAAMLLHLRLVHPSTLHLPRPCSVCRREVAVGQVEAHWRTHLAQR